jgi:hypothetical protein
MFEACLMAGLPHAYSSSHPTTPMPPPPALHRPPAPGRLAGRVAHVRGWVCVKAAAIWPLLGLFTLFKGFFRALA